MDQMSRNTFLSIPNRPHVVPEAAIGLDMFLIG